MLALAAVVAFVALGFWQLRRLDEKREFNEAVAAGVSADAVPYAGASGDPYVRVRVSGTYVPGGEALVLRARDGVSGHHVLTPLDVGDGRGLLVDRGWVPITVDEPNSAQAPVPAGEVSVEGVLWPARSGGVAGSGLPDVVPRIDPSLHDPAVLADLEDGRYLVLLEQSPPPADLPIAEEPPPLSEGPHLGYAVQWLLFAGVVVVGYPFVLRRAVRRG